MPLPQLTRPDEPCEPQTLGQALRTHAGDALRVLLVNSLIGVPVALILHERWGDSQVYSQAIGWSIFVLSVIFSRVLGATRADARALLLAVPLGSVAGMALASWIVGDGLVVGMGALELRALGMLALPLVIGAGMAYYFYSRGLLAEREAQLQEAELTRAVERQRAGEAQLKMLQAQIEPHFLFNTLSNVVGLIDERPQAAKEMLVDLTRLLRRSLLRSRADALPLGEEVADIRAYLDIQSRRLGPRLQYAIDVEPGLESQLVLPYLLQPLVENALQHGLEPLVEGGSVALRAAREGGQLRIEVADTGQGLRGDHPPGVALANIRDRLAARYGPGAQLSVHPNTPRGVVVRLVLPLAAPGVAAAPAA